MTNVKAHCASFTHISARLGGVMSAACWEKLLGLLHASHPEPWYRESWFAAGGGAEEIIAFQIFFFIAFRLIFCFVAIPTIKRKPGRPIKHLV